MQKNPERKCSENLYFCYYFLNLNKFENFKYPQFFWSNNFTYDNSFIFHPPMSRFGFIIFEHAHLWVLLLYKVIVFLNLYQRYKISRRHYMAGIKIKISTLDKQHISVNMQLKSSKKQLKWNVCVPKSNSNDRYAITCDVIAFHLVHFISIWVINKRQSGIDFFLLGSVQYNSFLRIKYRCPVQYFAEKHKDESETLQSVHARMSTRGWDLLQVQQNPLVWYFRKADNESE